MNDLDFRRLIYLNPRKQSKEMLQKQQQDKAARLFSEEMNELEDSLEDCLNIPAPTGLNERILAQYDVVQRRETSRLKTWLSAISALAASVLLAFTLVLTNGPASDEEISARVMQHVNEELAYLDFTHPFPPESTRAVVNLIGAELSQNLAQVNYAGLCQIHRSTSVHILLRGRVGMVTVLLMPGNPVDRTITLNDDRFQGLIAANGPGSIAIIGEKGEAILDVYNQLSQSLVWQI